MHAVVHCHLAGGALDITVTWPQLGYEPGLRAVVRDLYAERDLGVFEKSFTASVGNFDVAVLRVSRRVINPHGAGTERVQAHAQRNYVDADSNGSDDGAGWWNGLAKRFVQAISCVVHSSGCNDEGVGTQWQAVWSWLQAVPAAVQGSQHMPEPGGEPTGAAAETCGVDGDGCSSAKSSVQVDTVWRPWHHPAAAQLQERMRAAAQSRRSAGDAAAVTMKRQRRQQRQQQLTVRVDKLL